MWLCQDLVSRGDGEYFGIKAKTYRTSQVRLQNFTPWLDKVITCKSVRSVICFYPAIPLSVGIVPYSVDTLLSLSCSNNRKCPGSWSAPNHYFLASQIRIRSNLLRIQTLPAFQHYYVTYPIHYIVFFCVPYIFFLWTKVDLVRLCKNLSSIMCVSGSVKSG